MKIDRTLPHAVVYMYALSKGGMNLLEIIKSLANNENVYGESAREIGYVMRDVEHFGFDMVTPLKNVAENTPSEKFRDSIEGLISVINTGVHFQNFYLSR
ncbi:MAG: type II secretion system F family protein [Candidatus Syntropharchaeia archaeon]